jgi:hypothetical protein
VYVGGDFSGYFTDTGGIVETDYIVKWNTAANSWSALGSGLNSFVYTIAVSGKDIYVGGYFINAGGIAEADYIAMWHGADWSALGSGMDNNVNTIAEARETIYTGGSFSIAGGKPSSCFGGWMIPLSLTSPNGGEIWAAGSLHDITWKGTSGPVKLEYSTDDGSTWTTIVSSTDNDGNYGWSVPNTPSSQCRVRISHAADGNPVDSSDAAFLIAGFQLTSPNGGESWNADSHQTIRWNTIGSYADVRIDLSTNNGSTWRTLDWAAVNTGSYTWTPLPEMVSSLCLIRVVNWDSEVPYDTSDAVFSIIPAVVQTITVDSPNGGETWQAGTMRDVTWIYAGLAGDVKIDLYKGGVYSRTLGTANVNLRTYNWSIEISQPSGTDYRIRVWQGSVIDESDGDFAIVAAAVRKDDFVGTWDGQGVYYQNSDTGAWAKLASPATKITVGDLDGDGIDDLIGLWPGQGGIWVKYSQSGAWAKLSSTAQYIAAGDMNGDDRVDLVGTWDGQGVFYRNSVSGAWVKMATPATMVTAGDIDNDGIDDLIGLWPSQGGIWVKYSQTGTWAKLSSTAVHIATGDMNGDKRDDLLGTWDGQGVFYRDSATGTWVKMASPATLITTGDIDGDAIDDLIGIWPTQGGVWVKYSSDRTWERLSSTAQDIAAGKMRAASGGGEVDHSEGALGAQQEFVEFPLPMGGTEEGPGVSLNGRDLSDRGPGGARFVYLEDINLEPKEEESARLSRVPGPGEAGARCVEQDNLLPQETQRKEKTAEAGIRIRRSS